MSTAAELAPWLHLCPALDRLGPAQRAPIEARLADLAPRDPWECLIVARLAQALACQVMTFEARDDREADRRQARLDRQILALMRMLDQHRRRRPRKDDATQPDHGATTPAPTIIAAPAASASSPTRPAPAAKAPARGPTAAATPRAFAPSSSTQPASPSLGRIPPPAPPHGPPSSNGRPGVPPPRPHPAA